MSDSARWPTISYASLRAGARSVSLDPVPRKLAADASPDARQLAALLDIGQALSSPLELRAALERVLEKLERDAGVVRAAVMMLSEETSDIHIEVALGFGAEAQRVRYRLGEGITGRVVESGRPVVVPRVSREPLFLHRAVERRAEADRR